MMIMNKPKKMAGGKTTMEIGIAMNVGENAKDVEHDIQMGNCIIQNQGQKISAKVVWNHMDTEDVNIATLMKMIQGQSE